MSVGALSAVGGAFVPVNDAAVTLNTGYLVYKECVLRGIVDRMRENGTSELQRKILTAYNSGRDGNPQFSQNLALEDTDVADRSVYDYMQSGQLNGLNPTLKGPVSRAVLQGYMTARNQPNQSLKCTYSDLPGLYSGRPSGSIWDALDAGINPACNQYWATDITGTQMRGVAAYAVQNNRTQLEWYNGNYGIMGKDANGNDIVLTPGSVVGANAVQALQTGFIQLQNANDIDQMVGTLFAGITSQVVTSARGLVGLSQSTGGQASYLNQVVAQSQQGLRDSAINAGIQILVAQQQIELKILAAANIIINKITQISQGIRDRETACWNIIISGYADRANPSGTALPHVCADALKADNTCTAVVNCTTDPANPTAPPVCPTADKLKIATSSYPFAQQVIDSQIAPYDRVHREYASSSQAVLDQVAVLITQLTDKSSYTTQLTALQGLDRLISRGYVLHKPQDITNEQAAQGTLVGQNGGSGTLDQLLTDTATAWADGVPSGQAFSASSNSTGWCNVNNPAVIDFWHAQWKK